MKRHIATIRVDVDADSIEGRDAVLARVVRHIGEKQLNVKFGGVIDAKVCSVKVTRVRVRSRKR